MIKIFFNIDDNFLTFIYLDNYLCQRGYIWHNDRSIDLIYNNRRREMLVNYNDRLDYVRNSFLGFNFAIIITILECFKKEITKYLL